MASESRVGLFILHDVQVRCAIRVLMLTSLKAALARSDRPNLCVRGDRRLHTFRARYQHFFSDIVANEGDQDSLHAQHRRARCSEQ